MSKFKNNKMWSIFILLFLGFTNASAVSVGDRVYVIFGSESSAFVKGANVLKVGPEISKVEWNDCSSCRDWIKNSSFYYSRATAQARVDKMDDEHISADEILGSTAVVGGIGWLLYEVFKK